MRVLVRVPNFNMVTTFSGPMKNIPVALSIKPSTVSLPMFFYQKTMKHLFYFSKTFLHTISVFFINSKSRKNFSYYSNSSFSELVFFNNYITSVFHWNDTTWLVMKWSHDYKRDVLHPDKTQTRTCTCLHDDVRCKQSIA